MSDVLPPSSGRYRPFAPTRGRHDPAKRVAMSSPALLTVAVVVIMAAALVAAWNLRGSPSVSARHVERVCPVDGRYWFTDTFGAPRGGGRTHIGTDVFAAKGTPVIAVASGTITKAVPTDDGTLGGARVWIDADDGWWYYFAHLDTVTVEKGQHVATGRQIGTIGNTGNARTTPSHTHVEMHFESMEGPYVNPYAELSVLCPDSTPLSKPS